VLLLQPDAAEASRLTAELEARRCSHRPVSRIDEALRALGEESFHAMVVAPALLDCDLIACCAALRETPAAPPLLLLDRTGLLEGQSRQLPAGLRPFAVLPEPADIASLVSALDALVDLGPDAAAPARPITPRSDDFALVLGALARSRRTGTLERRCEGACTRIYLAAGRPVLAEGGALRDTLGRMLVRRGAVSQENYIRVIERMTERLVQNESVRMGEVLVELGLLEPSEVFRALSEQMTEKILACFRRVPFEWTFDEGEPPEDAAGGFEIPPVPRLILDGLRRHLPEGALPSFAETHGDARLAVPDGEALAAELGLGPDERRWLASFDGRRTLRALLAAAGDQSRDLAILGAALAASGRLRLGAADARPRSPRIPAAAPEPARPVPAPERIRAPRRDPARDRLDAERSFHAAQDALRAERVKEAFTAAQRAVALAPDETEYRMLEAWLAYLAAQVDLRIARAKAVACAERMAQEDPSAPRPHVILGRIALEDQRHDDACREFEFALLRNPADTEAVQGLHRARTGAGRLGGPERG
jgi:hypothetical protein